MTRRSFAARMPRRPSTARTTASTFGDKYGFKMDVKLAIQVEGARAG